jgi:hypothetical protein
MSYSLSRTTDRLSVVVPPRFSRFLFFFFPLWVCGWVTLVIVDPAGKPEPILVPAFFGLVTVVLAYQWLWNLAGREELEVTSRAVTSRRILFSIPRIRTFEMSRITDPHFVGYQSRGMSGHTPSGLGFSYDGKPIRLCDHVTQAEAKALVSEIIQQFPQHSERWSRYDEGFPDSDKDVALDLRF